MSVILHAPPLRKGSRQGCPNCQEPAVEALPAAIQHLYTCQRLSARRIAALLGLDRRRIVDWLRNAGVDVRPCGAGRRRPDRRADEPANLRSLLAELYVQQRRPARQVGALLGMPERTVRDRLREYGIARRTRGRCNREDRRALPPDLLRDLYVQAGLSADEVGRRIGVSRAVVLRSAMTSACPCASAGRHRSGGRPRSS